MQFHMFILFSPAKLDMTQIAITQSAHVALCSKLGAEIRAIGKLHRLLNSRDSEPA
jgi:hypothetical protein